MRHSNTLAMAAVLLASITTTTAKADAVADFYNGKTMKIIVGHQPGTGFDLYARVLARYFGKYIPGNPKFIVQNMNGASGIRSMNYIANAAPKDGTEMATMVFTAPFEPLLGAGKGKFDATRMLWIGNMDSSIAVCGVSRKSGISSFDELFKKELTVGATGLTGPFRTTSIAIQRLLGVKLKVVPGYKGSVAVRQAILRGEVSGACGVTISAVRAAFQELTKTGDFKLILQVGRDIDPSLKGVPHVYQYAKSEDDKKVFDLIFGIQALGRAFIGPAGVPPERGTALQKAFMDAMADKQLLAETKKASMDMSPMSGETLKKLVNDVYTTPKPLVARAREATK